MDDSIKKLGGCSTFEMASMTILNEAIDRLEKRAEKKGDYKPAPSHILFLDQIDPLGFSKDEIGVFATHSIGFPGDREQPLEPAGWTVQAVFWRGLDITSVLTTDELETIEEEINAA